MRKMLLATATALSMAAIPAMASAQDAHTITDEHQAVYEEMTDDQRAVFDTYDADRQTMYFGWNDALRGYYWSLDQERQDAWWYLNDEQRISLFQIQAPEQREAAWNSVVAQVNQLEARRGDLQARNNSATRTYANMRNNANVRFLSNAIVQDIPAPHQGEYPICESDLDDNCMNPWAAGLRGPEVERPLAYWPGESVTDMRSGG